MFNKLLIFASLFLFLSQMALGSPDANERRVLLAMRTLHGAEMTYSATYGNGNFGTLEQLGAGQLIDAALATGYKYGYKFAVTITPRTQTTPAAFAVTATPRKYRLYGKLSFYIATDGVLRSADRGGQPASENDPVVDEDLFCSSGSIPDNERCTLQSLRTLHGAEMTYAATHGNGNFGGLQQLRSHFLIGGRLASGHSHGYLFTVMTISSTPTSLPSFRIFAIPMTYGATGIRSFYIDTSGVIHGADRGGQPANENDPIIDDCTSGSISDNERCTISSLRTLHGAEMTWAATSGNGNYGGLTEMGAVNLIDQRLATGMLRGYSIAVVTFRSSATEPAMLRIIAVPQTYAVTGRRSFFIGTEGVIYAADKNGKPADENDPPLEQ